MSNCDPLSALTDAAIHLRAAVDGEKLASIPDAELQVLLAAAVRAYAAKRDAGRRLTIFGSDATVTATDVAVSASAMMEAVNMAVFELGMWQTLKGSHA